MKWTQEQYDDYQKRQGKPLPAPVPVKAVESKDNVPSKRSGPNKTELAAFYHLQMLYPGCTPIFEGLTLRLENGCKYTPDWVVQTIGGRVLCVEIKNAAYRHASYGRSKMAFAQAKIDWPNLQFRWLESTKDGWKEKY